MGSARNRIFLGWLAGIIGLVSTSIVGWSLFAKLFKESSYELLAAVIYLLALSTLVLGLSAFRQYQTIRKERYANIMPALHMTLHAIRDLETFILETRPKKNAPAEIREHYLSTARSQMSTIMSSLSNIFSSLTSTKCRACVKLTYSLPTATGDERVYFYAYARDRDTRQIIQESDDRRVDENHDPLIENEPFAEICKSENAASVHYCCNDLTNSPDFTSTSLTAYYPDYRRRWHHGVSRWRTFFHGAWPLPYRSCLAGVVRQGRSDILKAESNDVLGFVSVDSESRNVFEERWDKEIVFCVADSLYRPLKVIKEVEAEAG